MDTSTTSTLTDLDRRVIATVKAIAAACGENGEAMTAALAGTAGEGLHDGSYTDARNAAFGVLCADAEELVGIIRRLTGEDL